MRIYKGFGFRLKKREKGFFIKREITEEVFARFNIQGDNFFDAQNTLCNKMEELGITVAFIFPYYEED